MPKPKGWDEFERQITILAQEWLKDPNAQGNGRQGQSQAGVDVFGRRDCVHVGIQCKKKFEREVTEDELRSEVAKAATFKPKLGEFILATTAARDAKIQKVAREITDERDDFTVTVWSWEDIEEIAATHPRALRAFDPAYNPIISQEISHLSLSLKDELGELKALILSSGQVSAASGQSMPAIAIDDDQSTERHGKISLIQSLTDSGDIGTAEPLLIKIKDGEWNEATESERYALRIATANIAIKREKFSDAGQLLIEAAEGYPAHKNAKINLAVGYLLTERSDDAVSIATDILAAEPTNQKAADTLAQARAQKGDDDPFAAIDASLLNSATFCGLRVSLARMRDDSTWRTAATEGVRQHPDDKFLRRFAAEAVIEECVLEAPGFQVGEATQSIGHREIAEAATELLTQVKRLVASKGEISVALAHNAALACRLADDYDEAAFALRAGFSANPDDQSLAEQVAVLELHHGEASDAISILQSRERTFSGDLTLAAAFIEEARFGEARSLLDASPLPDKDHLLAYQFLAINLEWFRVQKKLDDGIVLLASLAKSAPSNPLPLLFLAKAFRLAGDDDRHLETIEQACHQIDQHSPFIISFEVADEAYRADLFGQVVELLKDRVPFDRESKALSLCIAAAMNGDMLRVATELLNKVSPEVAKERWYRRAKVALSNKVGDQRASGLLDKFLHDFPNDAEMRLARLGQWQTLGSVRKIRRDIGQTDLASLEGRPGTLMQFYRVAVGYGFAAEALPRAYRLLLNNWERPDCHLGYHSLFLANDRISGLPLAPSEITKDCAFEVESDKGLARYRIEQERPAIFGEEWLAPDNLLAVGFAGKRVGETVVIDGARGDQIYKIRELKSVYLDTLHRSLNSFNERFPSSGAMFQLSIDNSKDDPFVEMKEIVRRCGERDQQLLEFYRDHPIAMAWLASLLGKDEIECAIGVPAEGIKFRVCQGSHDERQAALSAIDDNEGRGVVVDAITAVIIKRLEVFEAVEKVCGPVHTAQTTIERLAERHFEAKSMLGRSKGSLGWKDGKYILTEVSEDQQRAALKIRKREWEWAQTQLSILPALPKADLSADNRQMIDMVGVQPFAPVLAADGASLPLLVDDFGTRVWAKDALGVDGFWLQPVLMKARDQGHLSAEAYLKAVLAMVEAGFSYISIDASTLIAALKEAKYDVSKISELLRMLCGVPADLANNLGIAAASINALDGEPCPPLTRYRLASEIARHSCYPRWPQAPKILAVLSKLVVSNDRLMLEHLGEWLKWNSMGRST